MKYTPPIAAVAKGRPNPPKLPRDVLESGLNMATQTIYIIGELGVEDVSRIVIALEHFNKAMPINIVMCCYGGEENAGYAIYDAILLRRRSGATINVTIMGCAQSIAVPVVMACTNRYITPEARIMIHNGHFYGQPEIIEQNQVRAMGMEAEFTANRYARVIAQRSKQPFEKILELCEKQDQYFSATEAVKLNFVDKILTYPNQPVKILKRKKK